MIEIERKFSNFFLPVSPKRSTCHRQVIVVPQPARSDRHRSSGITFTSEQMVELFHLESEPVSRPFARWQSLISLSLLLIDLVKHCHCLLR